MRILVRVFGREVFAFEVVSDELADESIIALVESLNGGDDDEDCVPDSEEDDGDLTLEIAGGHSHNFERDIEPYAPEDRYRFEWEDRFGFHAPVTD